MTVSRQSDWLRDLPRDGRWHRIATEPNYVWRADRASYMRTQARRNGLPITVQIVKPDIQARWDGLPVDR